MTPEQRKSGHQQLAAPAKVVIVHRVQHRRVLYRPR
jgi:hypothetical protein